MEFDLQWDQTGDRRYQWGVDRVAYYPLMGEPFAGEVWNGVVSVQEDSDGGEVSSMFYGGEKYGVYLAKEDFVATITGFYLPPSLERAAGYHSLGSGFIATLQPKEPFDLTYRTFVGDDHSGPEAHYRIHIVYGCMIEPYSTTHKTSTTRPEPGTTSWRVQTLPPYDIYTPNATAHYIIDTRYADPEVVAEVEEILYGRPDVPARMPGSNEWPNIFDFGHTVE